jgi:hypothetical protein
MTDKPLINKTFLLEKIPGKGGWTFVRIPMVIKEKKKSFGWTKVRGTIDGFEISKYHLMPLKGGGLFLPVKAEIRKKIKKEEGDQVHIILYPDNEPLHLPEELLLCMAEEPEALSFFKSLSESEQKLYISWVYSAKKEETKIDRMAKMINRLLKKQKLYEKEL